MNDYYERWIRPHEGRLIRAAWRITGNGDDAEDALQDALGRIWTKRRELVRHPNPGALVLRIGINASHDVLRRRARRQETLGEAFEAVADEPAILDRLQAEEDHREVRFAIAKLPRKQAEAVLLRFADERSYAEIAETMRCTESTVRTHIERARSELAKLLSHLKT